MVHVGVYRRAYSNNAVLVHDDGTSTQLYHDGETAHFDAEKTQRLFDNDMLVDGSWEK